MIISKSTWDSYAARQEKIRTEAARKMEAWLNKNGLANRDEMIAYAKSLSDRYGTASATLAADMYDAAAEAQRARVSPAVPAETPDIHEVAKVINGSLKRSIEGKLTASALERLVKQAAEDTMVQNAARDRAEFAWIPDGGACYFCILLGANGWQRASKDLLNGHAEHIHPNCNCEFAIRFDGQTNVAGYDPEALKEMYNDAAPGQNSAVKMKALRRTIANKDYGALVPLTEDEKGALLRYKSSESYLLNALLREEPNIEKLDSDTQEFVKNLDSALDKMPSYSGTIYRDLSFDGWNDSEEQLTTFLKEHSVGKVVNYSGYTSAAKRQGYMDKPTARLCILNSQRAKDISAVGLDEDEVIYKRHASIVILDRYEENGTWLIIAKEVEK